MLMLKDLEKAISALPERECHEFCRWFLEQDWNKWVKQIEEDANTGKLNF